MNIKLSLLSAAAALGCLSAQQASAQVLLGNLATSNDAGSPVTAINPNSWKSVGFTTPAQPYQIDSVQLRLDNYTAADNPFVAFYTGNNVEPATPEGLVGVLGDATPNGSTAVATFTFTPTGTLTLQPNTTYWLVVGGESGASFNWRSGNPSVAPTGEATFIGYKGATSFPSPGDPTWNANFSSFQNNFEIQATAVPEPAHYALAAAVGLIGFGVARRMRSKAA